MTDEKKHTHGLGDPPQFACPECAVPPEPTHQWCRNNWFVSKASDGSWIHQDGTTCPGYSCEADPSNWPTVSPVDDGIRPAGKPDECFYCQRKVGEKHKQDCVVVTKRVRVRVEIEYELDVPHSWNSELIEFENGGDASSCGNNRLQQIENYLKETNSCLCNNMGITYLGVVDPTPRRKEKETT